jgi:hypothetical protein
MANKILSKPSISREKIKTPFKTTLKFCVKNLKCMKKI